MPNIKEKIIEKDRYRMIGVNDYCKIERTVESKCELGNPFLSIKGLSENRLCNPLFN